MKTQKNFFLAIALFLIFTQPGCVKAQEKPQNNYYLEASVMEDYAKKYSGQRQVRYNDSNHVTLSTSPFNKDTIKIELSVYDTTGNNSTWTENFVFIRDKNDKEKYVCSSHLNSHDFLPILKNIFNELDNNRKNQ
jgi:hypothetical protein